MKKILISCIFFISFLAGAFMKKNMTDAASNMVVGYFRGDAVPGFSYIGRNYLINNGYGDYGVLANATPNHFYNSGMYYCNVVLITTHGGNGYFTIDSNDTIITGNSVTLYAPQTNSKLVYLAACNAGNSSSVYGNLGSALCSKGVSSVIAFTGVISSPAGTSGGIHGFNLMVVQLMKGGTILYNAISQAQLYYAGTSNTWGSEYAIFYGNGGLTL